MSEPDSASPIWDFLQTGGPYTFDDAQAERYFYQLCNRGTWPFTCSPQPRWAGGGGVTGLVLRFLFNDFCQNSQQRISLSSNPSNTHTQPLIKTTDDKKTLMQSIKYPAKIVLIWVLFYWRRFEEQETHGPHLLLPGGYLGHKVGTGVQLGLLIPTL